MARPHVVDMLLLPGVHLLDVAGPAQVLSAAGDLGADYQVRYLAPSARVPTAQGIPLMVTAYPWPRSVDGSTMMVPGWRVHPGPARRSIDPRVLERVRSHHDRGGRTASVCAGAFALASAGVLDGRRATTHHKIQAELAVAFPAVTVVPDVLYVSDGNVHTSAGIASGIDLTLHLVALDHGPGFAAQVARSIVVAARRNGEQRQDSVMLRYRDHLSDLVHRAQDHIDAAYRDQQTLASMAASLGVSERTLSRAFAAATGMTPGAYRRLVRIEQAEQLHSSGASWDRAAAEVGFSDGRALRRARQMSQRQ